MLYTTVDYKKRVFHAMNYISRNIERELPLEEVAEAASFSMFHFHRIFKAVAGETVAGFTRRLRLETAANRLSRDSEDITTIAMDCGFSSSQNFAKAFRQHFGVTPSEYRRSRLGTENSSRNPGAPLQAVHNSVKLNAEVREIPAYKVAYVRRIGPYNEETCGSAFAELLQWAVSRNCIPPGKILAIYWDNPEVTPPRRCRFDACIIVSETARPEGQVCIRTVGGGPYAVCHFELKPEDFRRAWEDAFVWLCDSGCECDDTPCYELYHNNAAEHPEGKWIFDICIPLKRIPDKPASIEYKI